MIIKDLGAVSAYAYAVEKGYTGTEAEYAELMASYATVAEEAAESAESASTSATSASASAQTATSKASEATTAAQTATAKAEEAQADADAAALDASQALSAASTATTKASEAAQSASDASTAKTAAQTAQTAAEGSATTAQTAAQTATQKAAEAAESARTLTTDTTLTQSGQAADSKVVGDEIEGVRSDLSDVISDIPSNFNDEQQSREQLEYVVASGLYIDDVYWKAVAGSDNSYGFKIPKAGKYYFASSGVFVTEEMTTAGQVFTEHQAITSGVNDVPAAGYYYKYHSTSIYAYAVKTVDFENVFKRGSYFSFMSKSATQRYTQGSEIQPATISALLNETYVGNYNGSYRTKAFQVAKGKTYIFTCDSYSVSFDVPLMMFVKYNKASDFSTRAYGYANPDYRANKVKAFAIPYYADIDGYIYIQTNNTDSLTIKCYEITGLESIPKQYPQYKKMLTIGDSLTSNGIWQPIVRDNLFIPQSSTVAVAGKCISNNGDDPIYNAVMALTADADVDLITLWAGTNDFAANVTLSTLEEQIATGTRDNTTFYGGVLDCVEHLITLYPKKRIIMIGTTPRTWDSGASDYQSTPNGSGKYLRDYVDAFHEVAKYYGLPFLDLLRTSGINLLNIDQYMTQQTSSGTTYYLHPTSEGYRYLGGLISAFIKSVG